jgi:hypothetical protein
MVTAELAAAIPAVVVVLALGLSAVRLGIDEIRCVDAARLAARSLARGDSEAVARAAAARAAPPDAAIDLVAGGSEVSATVSAARDLAGRRVLTVHGSATAVREEAGP